ncbi:glycosyltransferase family 4 protein [Rhizobium ruizarguesonis]|uniref:glycosyltransferase family 4 protein n=1 Tax=Rhizobium ruizarguesonis TaxID=2081791 RepID=UPI001FE0AB01|nr:glycosyltransferase family 4 protein [Rhizobium ruizarguesonis]
MNAIFALINRHPLLSSAARKLARRLPVLKSIALQLSYAAELWRLKPLTAGGKTYDPTRKTIILCVHDGSFTGAPILGWNLVRQLSQSHNVVCVLLSGGKLAAEFVRYSVGLVIPVAGSIGNANPEAFARRVIRPLREKFGADFILANSVESEIAISAAAILGIPSMALIHEFAEYTYPPRLLKVLGSAGTIVFSSELLAKSARDATGMTLPNAIIVPQGKCEVPVSGGQVHSSALDSLLNELADGSTFLCIGCGHVQMRKGVDLFIAAATQVLARGVRAKFVWVGDGYDPGRDYFLSVWLKDQIERGGYGADIRIVPALSAEDLEKLYRRADAMFLSSRLDPLPNVAIDALSAGVPVICFAAASGFPGYFEEDEILRRLVVPYFDFGTAAARIFEIANDHELRNQLSLRAVSLARRRFDMETYVELLVEEMAKTTANFAGKQ